MKSKQLNKDKMLGNLIRKSSLDSPGDDFTSKVMAQVQAGSHVQSIVHQPLISGKLWLAIGFALASLVVTVFFIDFSFIGNLFSGVSMEKQQMLSFFSNIFNSITQWFSGVKLSSVSAMVLISIGLLVIIERLLRKPKTTSTLMV
jgi:Na+/glutamate symporter